MKERKNERTETRNKGKRHNVEEDGPGAEEWGMGGRK